MKYETTCEHIIWSGFFGIDTDGNQPECSAVIQEDFADEEVEYDEDLEGYIVPVIKCPKCQALLEWPHIWQKVERLKNLSEVIN